MQFFNFSSLGTKHYFEYIEIGALSFITESCFYFLTTPLAYRQFLPTFPVVFETNGCLKGHYKEKEKT